MTEIHLNRDGADLGIHPITTVQQMLASGQLSGSEMAWVEGLPDWVPLVQIPGMAPPPQAPPGYAPPQAYAPPQGYGPPPGYAVPPQGYGPPPGYGAPPQGYGPPPGYAPQPQPRQARPGYNPLPRQPARGQTGPVGPGAGPVFHPGYVQPVPTSGAAITSMILGILSLPLIFVLGLGGLTGLAAVICGHAARGSIEKSRGQLAGGGLALAGLITGYLAIAIAVYIFSVAYDTFKQFRSFKDYHEPASRGAVIQPSTSDPSDSTPVNR